MTENDERLTVWVKLLNDDGGEAWTYASGETADEAVAAAEEKIQQQSGDDSFVMTDWGAA